MRVLRVIFICLLVINFSVVGFCAVASINFNGNDQRHTQGQIKVALAKIKSISGADPLISSGIPFARGQLKSVGNFSLIDEDGREISLAVKVLARWPQDQSIRSVLVQFKYPIEHVYEYVTLKWGEKRLSKDLKIVEPNWPYSQAMIVLPKEWLCASEVVGEQVPIGLLQHKSYDHKILKAYPRLRDKEWKGSVPQDGYYSTPHVFYQLYARTGERQYFIDARRELLHYRDSQIIQEGKKRGQSSTSPKARYVYVQALLDDYLLTGDPKSREVAKYMADYLISYIVPSKAHFRKRDERFWTERLFTFPMLGILSYYELTQDKRYLKIADQFMNHLYKTQMEWPTRGGYIHSLYSHDPEEGARKDEYGGSPFMTGLLLEAVIKYHKLTGSEKAKDSIYRALDWLINEGVTTRGNSFKYLTADKYMNSKGEPDTNLMIVHAFGYGYRLSEYKREDYYHTAQRVFQKGIKDGYIGSRKHFNQNYRSSGHYLAYVKNAPLKNSVDETDKENEKVLRKSAPKMDILYFQGFEKSLGKFLGIDHTKLSIDKEQVYLNGNSMKVLNDYVSSNLSVGLALDYWNIDDFPSVSFAYMIPKGTPLGMRASTKFGDWVCLGGTDSYQCMNNPGQHDVKLKDDGKWHEITFDARKSVKELLPKINQLIAFQFFTKGKTKTTDWFWIDEFKIKK